MRLEGKVAIVTGGANGMGAEESRLFAREGASVVVADMRDEDGETVVSQIAEAGGTGVYVHADVTSESDWRSLVDQAIAQFGKVDILVNNAGISGSAYADPLDLDGWTRIMDVNATGVFLGTRASIPVMQESGGGSIVNISSIMGFVGAEGGHPAYHASKGAVRIFTKAMAVKYGPDGIRANSVHPGFMPPMTGPQHADRAVREARVQLTPLRRTGEVREVANGVLFLASDEASFITGAELVIDGGFIAQ
jgi:NAD(P)-dependent dehydrogenase (short-subunit alcohol dehydrogenase family)